MSKISTELVELVDESFERNWTEVTFPDQTDWSAIDRKRPGWYLIKTDATPETFELCTKPEGTNWVDMGSCMKQTKVLEKHGLAIPFSDTGWVVYNGEVDDLRPRLKAHCRVGDRRTGCLSLAHYPSLRECHWWFTYAYVSDIPGMSNLNSEEDKAVRVCIEQAWRFVHGWPRLCSR